MLLYYKLRCRGYDPYIAILVMLIIMQRIDVPTQADCMKIHERSFVLEKFDLIFVESNLSFLFYRRLLPTNNSW